MDILLEQHWKADSFLHPNSKDPDKAIQLVRVFTIAIILYFQHRKVAMLLSDETKQMLIFVLFFCEEKWCGYFLEVI